MNDLQNAPVSPAPAGRSTLLVVDDDAINCGILEHIFSPYYNIGMAHDGQAGLDYILERQDSLCAVLLDVVMPRMDGLQVLRSWLPGPARAHPGLSHHGGSQRQRDERSL